MNPPHPLLDPFGVPMVLAQQDHQGLALPLIAIFIRV